MYDILSRKQNENDEGENSNNRLYHRNINDIAVSSLSRSNISKSQPILPTTRFPPDPEELPQNTVNSPLDYFDYGYLGI